MLVTETLTDLTLGDINGNFHGEFLRANEI